MTGIRSDAWDTLYFAEYNNYGEGATPSERAPFVTFLTDKEAAEYTQDKVLEF